MYLFGGLSQLGRKRLKPIIISTIKVEWPQSMGIGEYWVLEFWTLWVLGIAVSGSVGIGYCSFGFGGYWVLEF